MNREQLAKNVRRHVRLRPPATTADGRRLDDDWRIVTVTDSRVELRHIGDDAPLRLGLDHVNRYSSDPQRDDEPNAPYGFLVLNEKVVRQEDGQYVVEIAVPGDFERRMASTPKYSPAVLAEAKEQYGGLGHVEREAIRQLLVVGQMTDAQMEKHLSRKGLAHGAHTVLQGLSNQTTLVLRVVPERQHGEHVSGYKGPYMINPVFKEVLGDFIAVNS